MPSAPKILYLVTEDWYFCSHRLPLAIAAAKSGYDVVVATRVNQHQRVIERAGLRVIPLRRLKRESMNPLRELSAMWELIKIYRQERPSLVHHVALKPVLYGTLAARIARIPGIVNALGGLGFVFASQRALARLLKIPFTMLFKWLLNTPNCLVIVQNQDDVKVLKGLSISTDHIRLIRGAGVDLDSYCLCPINSSPPSVVLASRMLWDKGVGEFVEAARKLRSQGVNAKFILAGDTDPHNPTAIPVPQLKVWDDEGFIEWLGYSNDMPQVLSEANIVCLPSYYEGLPKVLIEAMACGRPIVTTDVPGCRELVNPEVNGILVPPRDVDALADALNRLINDKELCSKMGHEGRKMAESEFAQPKIIQETLTVYTELQSSCESW
ncbi:MAG TPA: glycosyltransferase family 4 protein [Methylophilaceae bacterium]|nr:glycosyltransferase family 4 protein [Methylophilaceae bacterium]